MEIDTHLSPKKQNQVTGIIADWLLRAIEKRGLSLTAAALDMGLSESYFNNPLQPLPLELYAKLFEWASVQVDDDDFAVQMAQSMSFSELGLLGYLITNSSSIKALFNNIDQFFLILQQEGSITLRCNEEDDTAKVLYHSGFVDPLIARQDIEFTLAMVVKGIRHILNDTEWVPEKTFFVHPSRKRKEEAPDFFGEVTAYNYAYNAITFDKALLDVKTDKADCNLFSILSSQAMKSVEALSQKPDVAEQVRWLITSTIGQEKLSSDDIAEKLGITRRTLHRQLKERGTCFRTIKQLVIKEMAKEALAETDTDITYIALQLGFSETSAFSRAFKQLVGVHPNKFRQQSRL